MGICPIWPYNYACVEGSTHVMEVSQFEELHRAQLQAIGFPPGLVSSLLSKLSTGKAENFEGKIELSPDEKGEQSACGRVLRCARSLPALSEVFVLQHVWESDGGSEARRALLTDPTLLAKVESALGIVGRGGEEVGQVMEEMTRMVCEQSHSSKAVARRALTETGYDLIAAIALAPQLTEKDIVEGKEDHPSLTMDEFRKGLGGICDEKTAENIPDDQIQALYEDWKEKKSREPKRDSEKWVDCCGYKWRLEEDQIITVSIPLPPSTKKKDVLSDITSKRWKFSVRGRKPIINGDFFGRVVPDDCFWTMEGGCVTVSIQVCGEGEWGELIVGEVQGEGERGREREVALRVEEIMARMWYVNQTYTAVTREGKQRPVWYLMEEHGLALTHSQRPNFACHPFANALTGCIVSVLWPLSDVKAGEVCSRNYVPSLFPGETQTSRNVRESLIMSFRTCRKSGAETPVSSNSSHPVSSPLPSLPTSPSHPPPSTPVKLYISTKTNQQSVAISNSVQATWDCPDGYSMSPCPEDADLILGYYELLPSTQLKAWCSRLNGDHVLVHKTHFCRLVRGKDCAVQGVDVRMEACLLTGLTRGVVNSWYLVSPDGPWSAVPHHITNQPLEMVRLSEVGPAVAMQFLHRTVLYKNHCCCLQFSVVVVGGEEGSLSAYLHLLPRVRVANKPLNDAGFLPWDTPTLITSGSRHVAWGEFLSSLMASYKTEWGQQCQSAVMQAISGVLALALPQCKGKGALYTVDVLLLQKDQLVPIIIGVDPTPSFASSSVAKDCLDLLLGHKQTDKFVSL